MALFVEFEEAGEDFVAEVVGPAQPVRESPAATGLGIGFLLQSLTPNPHHIVAVPHGGGELAGSLGQRNAQPHAAGQERTSRGLFRCFVFINAGDGRRLIHIVIRGLINPLFFVGSGTRISF